MTHSLVTSIEKRTRVVNIVTILRFLRNLKCLYSALTQVWLGIELQVENDPLSPRPTWFLRFQRRPDSQAVRPGSRVSPSQETFTMPSPLMFWTVQMVCRTPCRGLIGNVLSFLAAVRLLSFRIICRSNVGLPRLTLWYCSSFLSFSLCRFDLLSGRVTQLYRLRIPAEYFISFRFPNLVVLLSLVSFA